MTANYQWHSAETRNALAGTLAAKIGARLNAAITENGEAVLALSGGSTPKPLFEALAKHNLDWRRIIITLVDERWVPVNHALSNEAFLHKFLLTHLSENVRFVSLYSAAGSASESLDAVLSNYCQITQSSADKPKPFDVVVLGMGDDGHTASFFPDATNISELVDALTKQSLISCESPTTQVPRITWTVPMLLNTQFLALHITGQSKRQTFEAALQPGDVRELPIRCALFQQKTPLRVYFAD